MISLLKLRVPEAEVILFVKVLCYHSFLLQCDIKDVGTDALGLSPLHPQYFASSTGAVLGAVLDSLQHCSGSRSNRAAGAVFSDTLDDAVIMRQLLQFRMKIKYFLAFKHRFLLLVSHICKECIKTPHPT